MKSILLPRTTREGGTHVSMVNTLMINIYLLCKSLRVLVLGVVLV